MCALQWSDIDFSGGTVHIQRTAYRINYGGRTELVIQTPKSKCSERVIPLTAKMLSLLHPLKTSGYLLTGSDRPMEPRTLQYRFRRFLERLEIPVRNFHILRHSCATRCIEYGMVISNPSPKSWATPTCKPPYGCMSIPPWNPNAAAWSWQAPYLASPKKPIRRQKSGHGQLKKRELPKEFLREYRQGFSLTKAFLLFYYTIDSQKTISNGVDC